MPWWRPPRSLGSGPQKRIAAACMVGTAVEFYDFYIYGTAAALTFPTVFFPNLSATMATVASMGTFAAAFVSRPLVGPFLAISVTASAARPHWLRHC